MTKREKSKSERERETENVKNSSERILWGRNKDPSENTVA